MRTLFALLALALAAPAMAAPNDPFLPAAPAPAKLVKALTPPDFLNRDALEAFETETGTTVALDIYNDPAEFAARVAEQKYDVMILRGPTLARRIATLARLDRRRLPNARAVQGAVTSKYVLYDREAAFGVPYGWSAFGLIYDADRIAPASWSQALGLAKDRPPDCGIVWPNLRDESFFAVWRLLGVDPARPKSADVKSAAQTLDKARGAFLAFAAPDEVGAFAKGAACLGAGDAGDAAAALARGGENAPNVRFVYPKEGAPLAIYAFAIPLDAPAPDAAYQLIDAMLAPEIERRATVAAGLVGAQEPVDVDVWRRLFPEPVLQPALINEMQSEWKRLTAAK